jgi:hypothetical protein
MSGLSSRTGKLRTMDNRAYERFAVALVLAGMVMVAGCGGGGEIAENLNTYDSTVTGVKVYVTDQMCSYAVYGGKVTPPLLPGNCLNPEAQVNVAAWMAIGDNPAGHQCVRLGEAPGRAISTMS